MSLPLVCIECGRVFQEKTVAEKQKDGTTVNRVSTALEQARRHLEGRLNVKGQYQMRKHVVFPVSEVAWNAGHYQGWPETRFKKE